MAWANWACLSTLDLLDSRLSYAAMHQLVIGLWQNLWTLDLSRSQLEEAALSNAMTALSKGKMPNAKHFDLELRMVMGSSCTWTKIVQRFSCTRAGIHFPCHRRDAKWFHRRRGCLAAVEPNYGSAEDRQESRSCWLKIMGWWAFACLTGLAEEHIWLSQVLREGCHTLFLCQAFCRHLVHP